MAARTGHCAISSGSSRRAGALLLPRTRHATRRCPPGAQDLQPRAPHQHRLPRGGRESGDRPRSLCRAHSRGGPRRQLRPSHAGDAGKPGSGSAGRPVRAADRSSVLGLGRPRVELAGLQAATGSLDRGVFADEVHDPARRVFEPDVVQPDGRQNLRDCPAAFLHPRLDLGVRPRIELRLLQRKCGQGADLRGCSIGDPTGRSPSGEARGGNDGSTRKGERASLCNSHKSPSSEYAHRGFRGVQDAACVA